MRLWIRNNRTDEYGVCGVCVCMCVCVVNLVKVVLIFKVKKDIKDK